MEDERLSPPALHVNRSGYWEIRWTERDERTGRARSRTHSCRTKDRRVAEDALAAFLTASAAVAPVASGGLTVRDCVERYLAGHVEKNGRTASQDWNLKNVTRGLGAMRVADLTEGHVDFYARKRLAAGRATGTVRRELSALRAALAWSVRKGLVPAEAVPHFDLPAESPARTRYLDEAEEERLWDAAEDVATDLHLPMERRRVGLFVCLALETAARSEAIRGLTWDRVDLKRGVVDYNEPGRRVSNKRRAVVPISDRLRAVLDVAHALALADGGGVAEGPVLGHTGSVRGSFERLCARVGIEDVTVHDLRRTWATLRVSWGVPLQDVARVLGDSIEVVERHYAVFAPDYLRDAVNVRGRRKP